MCQPVWKLRIASYQIDLVSIGLRKLLMYTAVCGVVCEQPCNCCTRARDSVMASSHNSAV